MSTRVFHCFPMLPAEVRHAIWNFCLPCRVVELERPISGYVETYCELSSTSIENAKPPLIASVCRESRNVALRSGWFLRKQMDKSRMALVYALNVHGDQWTCPKTDIVQLYYNYGYEESAWPHFDGDVYGYLYDAASITKGASIMADLVHCFPGEGAHLNHPCLVDLRGIEHQACLMVINVHLTEEQALETNLFGITGEELVKYVDAYTVNVSRYMALAHQLPGQDTEGKEQFALLASSDFPGLVAEWVRVVEMYYVFREWRRALGKERPYVPTTYPDELLRHHDVLGTVWNSPLDENAWALLPHKEKFQSKLYALNRDNAWVQKTIDGLPRFKPVVMFRLCRLECWKRSKI